MIKKITEIKNRDPLTEKIIACAYRVHSELGPGFSESVYHNALKIALEEKQLKFQTEKGFNVSFNGKGVGKLRLDLVVEDKVIVEVQLSSRIKAGIEGSIYSVSDLLKKK